MATIDLQGTKFSFSVLPIEKGVEPYWVQTEIKIENEFVAYYAKRKNISVAELQSWIFSMFRLLAGAYGSEYSLSFEKADVAVDFYPYTKNGERVSRETRRRENCVMAIRLLMYSSEKSSYLGGVYSLLLRRENIEIFATELQREFEAIYSKNLEHKEEEKYLFAGVSPKGFKGCNYWYFAPENNVRAGDYVWVRMGRHNTEQIVYVDSVKYFDEQSVPRNPRIAKRVLRKATKEEIDKDGF